MGIENRRLAVADGPNGVDRSHAGRPDALARAAGPGARDVARLRRDGSVR